MTSVSSGPEAGPSRRPYDNSRRLRQAAATRARILQEGAALARACTSWDWRELTHEAVGERAGVSRRTVFRSFPTVAELHRAIVSQLETESGVHYENLTLDEVSETGAKVFESYSAFAAAQEGLESPLPDEDRKRRDTIARAVAAETQGWTLAERERAAAVLDVLWSVESYRRLVSVWEMSIDDANASMAWAIKVVLAEIRADHRP